MLRRTFRNEEIEQETTSINRHVWLHQCLDVYFTCGPITLGVEESKQLPAQLSVGHGLPDEGFLLSQLLRTEVLCLSSHPVVVVQHSK